MGEFVRRSTLVLAMLVTCACAPDSTTGAPEARVENHYRDRVLDQLDLPLQIFENWEVVDADHPPEPAERYADLTTPNPAECAIGGDLATAAWDVLGSGTRWTGASGTGPDGQTFAVTVFAGDPASTRAVDDYVDACGRTEFGAATVLTLSTFPGITYDTVGFTAATATAATTYLVARTESLRLVLVYTYAGEPQRNPVEAVWKAAYKRFTQPR